MNAATQLLIVLGIAIACLVGSVQAACWVDEWLKVRKWKRMGFTPDHIESLKAQYFR